MLNRVVLIGRLTRDPELRYTPTSGIALTNFTLAVDRPFQSAKGERETDFIRIICWGKLAERCKEHLGKGRLVAVDGRLQIRNWETNTGERRQIVEVRADDVRFLDRAPSARDGGGSYEGPDAADYEDETPQDDAPRTPARGAKPAAAPGGAGKKNFGEITDQEIDEEIDLDDDPF